MRSKFDPLLGRPRTIDEKIIERIIEQRGGAVIQHDNPTGGATPAGVDGSIQINLSNELAFVTDFQFLGSQLLVPGSVIASGNLETTGQLIYDLGSHQIILDAGNTSALHTLYLPDEDGTLAIERPVYSYQDYEKTDTYIYVGYTEAGGAWYIYRRIIASNTRQYATGATDYATNWTNRGSQTYV